MIGVAKDVTGSATDAFLVLALCALGAAVLVLALGRDRRFVPRRAGRHP